MVPEVALTLPWFSNGAPTDVSLVPAVFSKWPLLSNTEASPVSGSEMIGYLTHVDSEFALNVPTFSKWAASRIPSVSPESVTVPRFTNVRLSRNAALQLAPSIAALTPEPRTVSPPPLIVPASSHRNELATVIVADPANSPPSIVRPATVIAGPLTETAPARTVRSADVPRTFSADTTGPGRSSATAPDQVPPVIANVPSEKSMTDPDAAVKLLVAFADPPSRKLIGPEVALTLPRFSNGAPTDVSPVPAVFWNVPVLTIFGATAPPSLMKAYFRHVDSEFALNVPLFSSVPPSDSLMFAPVNVAEPRLRTVRATMNSDAQLEPSSVAVAAAPMMVLPDPSIVPAPDQTKLDVAVTDAAPPR